MKKLIVMLAALVCLTIAAPASATPPDPNVDEWHTWSTSLAPGVTMPTGAGDVTWPQPYIGQGQIAPACGQWVQQDRYKGKQSKVNAVLADGQLTMGPGGQPEDHAIVQEWRFVYGGDCIPEQPDPIVTVEDWSTPPSCETPTVLMGSITTTIDWVYNEETNAWDQMAPVVVDTRTEVSLSAGEPEACTEVPEEPEPPVVVPPAKPATPTPVQPAFTG